MAGSLMPCAGCNRHVRTNERACPFCGSTLELGERVLELRLLTRFDRSRMVALGAVLSAAGIALGCQQQQVVAVYGAPPSPVDVPSAAPSAEPTPPAATPAPSGSVLVPTPVPAPSAPPAAPTATSAPTGAPAAVYGAPPRPAEPALDPKSR